MASGARVTSAAVASTAPSGKASSAPRKLGRRRPASRSPRAPAGTTKSATAIASGKPIQYTSVLLFALGQQVGQQAVGAALDPEAALGAEQREDHRQLAGGLVDVVDAGQPVGEEEGDGGRFGGRGLDPDRGEPRPGHS